MRLLRSYLVALTLVVLLPAARAAAAPEPAASATPAATVGARADSILPPPPLPYVDEVQIGPPQEPLCPGDSIAVEVRGRFPNTCFFFRKIEIVPIRTFAIGPPLIRITVDDGACLGLPCAQAQEPWSARIVLPPITTPGSYTVGLQIARTSCPDTVPADSAVFTSQAYFTVSPCGQVRPCLIGDWVHPGGPCDATFGADDAADVAFTVASPVALAGLEGSFVVGPGPARITGIEAIGPAQGMHLTWTSTDLGQGARFALFAEHGAPIPPALLWGDSSALGDTTRRPGHGVPILRVRVVRNVRSGSPVMYVSSYDLLGADAEAHGVPECPDLTPIARAARICNEVGCDANGDGLTDIRDIVLMVHCWNHEGFCPDTTGVFDCNGDGHSSLDDVICCALKILRQGSCPDCPVDSGATRPAPDVRVNLGAPLFTDAGVDVPVRLAGSDGVGGARLSLSYPSDRYEITSVEFPEDPSWLHLSQVQSGEALIGLIRLLTPTLSRTQGTLELTLHLRLKPGQANGGEIVATDGEFSGADGVRLDVAMGHPSLALGGPANLSLSEGRPNPFGTTTSFTLTLDRPGDVEVGIYDLGGRLVATLHHGPLSVGPHDFVWDGARGDGTAAENGVYFYRALTSERGVSRKLILLRGN